MTPAVRWVPGAVLGGAPMPSLLARPGVPWGHLFQKEVWREPLTDPGTQHGPAAQGLNPDGREGE